MFDKEYDITGRHAIYTRFLAGDARQRTGIFGNYSLFDRYLDVYLNGAIFGLLYNRTAKRDVSTEEANIPASAFNTSRADCVFLYRLVMLLEKTTAATPEERIDRAFRHDADEKNEGKLAENMNLFHSYVLGGIEVMYEKFTEGTTTPDDYIDKLFTLMSSFQEEIQGIPYEDKLAELMN